MSAKPKAPFTAGMATSMQLAARPLASQIANPRGLPVMVVNQGFTIILSGGLASFRAGQRIAVEQQHKAAIQAAGTACDVLWES